MVTPHSGETDSLEVVATGRKYVNCKYTPFLASYMTKSQGTRLKLICDGPELKTLCHKFITFIAMWLYNKNVFMYYYSGLDIKVVYKKIIMYVYLIETKTVHSSAFPALFYLTLVLSTILIRSTTWIRWRSGICRLQIRVRVHQPPCSKDCKKLGEGLGD